jgi:paraquat-inducible protein B
MDESRPAVRRTQAEVRRGWWPGWVWAIPIAALLLVGWWLFRTFMTGGEDITIEFDDAHGVKAKNTSVVFRGVEVGRVEGVTLAKDGRTVAVTAHIQDNATRFLTAKTEFWLRGANPSLSDLSTLSAVLSGPTIVMEAGPGQKATHFVGLPYRPVVSAGHGPPQLYGVSLEGAVGELKPGDPVKLRGFDVGEVRDVEFRYDAQSGKIEAPVTLALYPALFHLAGAAAADGGAFKAAIDHLIQHGLRARLQRDPPLIGNPQIALDVVPGEGGAAPSPIAGVPQIPAAAGGGISSLVDRLGKVPIDRIAENVADATHHVDALVSSPKLDDAITQLDAALAQIHETAANAAPQVTALVRTLRKTAGQLDGAVAAVEQTAKTARQTAASADKLLGGQPSQSDMQKTLHEITEAARSVRELADYLDRHPEALIQGKSGE